MSATAWLENGDEEVDVGAECLESLLECETLVLPNKGVEKLLFRDGAGARLVHLTVNFNRLTTLDFVHSLPGLRHLNVQHNLLQSLSGIPPSSRLRVLRCSSNQLPDLDGLDARCPELQELWVAQNEFSHPVGGRLHVADNSQILTLTAGSCVSDPKLYICGKVKSLLSVDGCSIDNTTREASSKYLDKGFSPAAIDTDASFATNEVAANAQTRTSCVIDMEASRLRPTDGSAGKPAMRGGSEEEQQQLPSTSRRECSSGEAPGHFEGKNTKKPSGTLPSASAGGTEASTLPRPTSSGGADSDPTSAISSRPDTAASRVGSAAQASTSHEQPQEPITEQQVFYPSNNKKPPKLALTVRSNGTAVFLWPNGKVAVMIDYVALRGSNKGASGGYSASASHHKSGAFALNFDAAGTGVVNHPPPLSGSILLSTTSSGSGNVMDKNYNIVRQWDAKTGVVTNGTGQACHLAATSDSLKALGLPNILPKAGAERSLHLPLSKHLGIRLSLCQSKERSAGPASGGRSEPQLEIFVKVAGLRVRLERGATNTIQSAVKDPAGGLFDP